MIIIRVYRFLYLFIVTVIALAVWPIAFLLERFFDKRPDKFIELIYKGAREDLLYKKDKD